MKDSHAAAKWRKNYRKSLLEVYLLCMMSLYLQREAYVFVMSKGEERDSVAFHIEQSSQVQR